MSLPSSGSLKTRAVCQAAAEGLPLYVGEQPRDGVQELLDRVESEEPRQFQEAFPHRRLVLQLVEHQHGGGAQRTHLLRLRQHELRQHLLGAANVFSDGCQGRCECVSVNGTWSSVWSAASNAVLLDVQKVTTALLSGQGGVMLTRGRVMLQVILFNRCREPIISCRAS